jgi:HAD superfamily hydrolase (TIGR01458 family)
MQARGILFDMDGVLYNSETLIPGASDAIRLLCDRSIPHLFVTNTTSRSRAVLGQKLAAFGIPGGADRILTPPLAAAEWLRAQPNPGPAALFVRDAARPDFDGLPLLPDDAERGADYVIIGDLGTRWDFRTLNRAFRLLHHNPQAVLIALGMTRYWMSADGIALDTAPFVAALQHATGCVPMVFGKPAANFFHAAAARLELPPADVVMVGDDIETDVRGALAAGLRGVLVRTGKFNPRDLLEGVQPTAVIDSISSLPKLLDVA